MTDKEIFAEIEVRITHHPFLIAIDGRCAAGKTTLAAHFSDKHSCTVIHADDFFLRPEQRTETRLKSAGENIDHERLLNEVLIPLKSGLPFAYRPFDCKSQSLKAPVQVIPSEITVIEGSYCCHPELWDYYDLRVFLNIDKHTQLERIKLRNPDKADIFRDKWIPLEESYFTRFKISDRCDLSIKMRQSLWK